LQYLLPRVSQHRGTRRVHVNISSLRIGNKDAIRRLFHQKPEVRLALAQRFRCPASGFLDPHLLRHVALDAPCAHQHPVLDNPDHTVAKYLGISLSIHFMRLALEHPESRPDILPGQFDIARIVRVERLSQSLADNFLDR